ncbi:MAG: NAD(P)H dehydrogenase (quinone) [Methanosaeta sp. PtaU1.Bin060]|jgi:NAD(P)H dehydrogenase (quinone)|nr:MAG: NAD(P)H dehydrogenase (quinone) [Methanosaeta sp. PtaU1.Bin060]
MSGVLVIYHSRTGNTAKMAEAVAEGARSAGAQVVVKRAAETNLDDLKSADGIIIGSPTYYGLMAAEIKQLFDGSSDVRGQLENKVGAAFTSSASIEGGNQTTLLSILQAMLIHAMIVAGDPMDTGGHYGVISIGEPKKETLESCKLLGARVADLAKRLAR